MNTCCNNLKWKFVADANSADGCEFTIGSCENCQADLIHLFYTSVSGENYVVAGAELISQILHLHGKEQKEFMRQWHRKL